jgi:excisionase family DNA binding protein
MDKLYDMDQTSELLKVSKSTLARWKKERMIPYIKIGRKTLFDYEDLIKLIEDNKIGVEK